MKNRMKKLIITLAVIIVSAGSLYSQNKAIRGRVISDNFEIVPLALIIINVSLRI
jgi:hypothetical protein